MMIVLLIAGIGAVLAGVLAIVFGIPIKEFGFGNTLILVGVIGACTGMILLGLWLVVGELKLIAQRLRPGESRARTAVPSIVPGAEPSTGAAGDEEFPVGRDRAAAENAGAPPSSPPPWHEEDASRDRVRVDAPTAPEAEPAPKPRRNLLFSSTSRKERERAQARAAEPAAPAPPVAPPVPDPAEAPPASFDDAWPKSERARGAEVPPQRRSGRAPSTFSEPNTAAPDQPPVTVLKSGVVDGMAYSLYSDGSIEAQLPEGMMRFASIDELRAHLDHRP
jgi:hypothetical protein